MYIVLKTINNKMKRPMAILMAFALILTSFANIFTLSIANAETPAQKMKIRFIKEDNNYDNWDIWTWWPGQDGKAVTFDYQDKEGKYALIDVPTTGELGLIIRKSDWSEKATGDVKYDLSKGSKEIVVTYGSNENPKSIEERDLIRDIDNVKLNIHYNRTNSDYDGWNLWTWGAGLDGQVNFNDSDDYGKVSNVELNNVSSNDSVGFIVRKGDWEEKDIDKDRAINLIHTSNDGTLDIYLKQGDEKVYYHNKPQQSKPVQGLDGKVNKTKLYHDTRDSVYKLPFGAVAEDTDVTVRFHSQKNDLEFARVQVRNTKTNKSNTYTMNKVTSTTINEEEVDIYEATFTPNEMGVYGYKFIAGDGQAVVEYGDVGAEGGTGGPYDKNAATFQLTVHDKNYKTPDWMKESVVYQIFPDRFNNGDKSNDDDKTNARGNEPIEAMFDKWGNLPDNPRIFEKGMEGYTGDTIWANDFFGGDIKGIQSKLDYLQNIGVNTIYLNPISMAASNHKYDATDYKKLDPMFGMEADFKAFTGELENRGMHLIVDGVFNHVGDDSIYFDRYGKYEWVGAYEYWSYIYDEMNNNNLSQEAAITKADKYFVDKGQKFSDEKWHLWFNIKNQKVDVGTTDERYDYQCWWGYDSLPEFKSITKNESISLGLAKDGDNFVNKESEFNNKSLVNYIYMDDDSVAKQWINWGADGWRLDVANEVETTFWNEFRTEMKSHNPNTLILGEIWDDASKYFVGDEYDSVMNYRIRGALIEYLKGGTAEKLDETLMAVYEDYPKEAFYSLMNLMGSHDTARAMYILGYGSDGIERAEWDKNYNAELGEERLKLASLFEFGYPGAPTIYYGDEAGVIGSKDPDCRRTYPWGGEDLDLVDHYKLIGKIRKDNKDLFSHGDLVTLYAEDDVYVYGRKLNDKMAIVALNQGNTSQTVEVDISKFAANGITFEDQYSGNYSISTKDGKVFITIPKLYGRILVNTNTAKLPSNVENISGVEKSKAVELTFTGVEGATEYKIYKSNLKGSLEELVTTVTEPKVLVDNLTNGQKYYFAVSAVDANNNESKLVWSEGFIPSYNIDEVVLTSKDINVDKINIPNPVKVSGEVLINGVSDKEGVSEGLAGRLAVKYPSQNLFKSLFGGDEWRYYPVTYVSDKDGRDVFEAEFIPTLPGKYEYKFEFSTKGNWGFESNEIVASDVSNTNDIPKGEDTNPIESITLTQPEQQNSQVNLKWSTTGDNNVAMYEIVRDGKVISQSFDKSLTSFKDTNVQNGVEYAYKILAYGVGGNIVSSQEVKVTPDLLMIEVTFKLNAPEYTPHDEKVTIPGTMNGWSTTSWEMSRNGAVSTDWTYKTYIQEGETIKYKYVKGGSWDQEALMNYSDPVAAKKSEYGCSTGEGGDEEVTIVNQGNGKMVIENKVIRWKDMPVVITTPSNDTTTKNETITIKGNAIKEPDLTINGETVVVKEDGSFEHNVKLNVGENNIKVHVEPTDKNKDDVYLFNKNAEWIGFATKDIELKITRTMDNVVDKSEIKYIQSGDFTATQGEVKVYDVNGKKVYTLNNKDTVYVYNKDKCVFKVDGALNNLVVVDDKPVVFVNVDGEIKLYTAKSGDSLDSTEVGIIAQGGTITIGEFEAKQTGNTIDVFKNNTKILKVNESDKNGTLQGMFVIGDEPYVVVDNKKSGRIIVKSANDKNNISKTIIVAKLK